jgi:hypothetical protein
VDQDIEFLEWLSKRLIYRYRYNENDIEIKQLRSIVDRLKFKNSIKISNSDLDKIIAKYYVDFFLNKEPYANSDIGIGYTNKERDSLRQNIRSLIFDVVNKNIPQETIIKDT